MKIFYHATSYENLSSIAANGLRAGCDGCVYLAETKEDALKFVYFRGYEKVLVVQVALREDSVEESFDHSYAFFKCRAWVHKGNIDFVDNFFLYDFGEPTTYTGNLKNSKSS